MARSMWPARRSASGSVSRSAYRPRQASPWIVVIPIESAWRFGERHDGICVRELAAEHEERLRRSGDVGHDEVEGARARHEVRRARAEAGAGRERAPPSAAFDPSASCAALRCAVTALTASSRATGSGSPQGSSMNRKEMRFPRASAPSSPRTLTGTIDLRSIAASPRSAKKPRSASGDRGQQHIVDRRVMALLDPPEVVERPAHDREVARRASSGGSARWPARAAGSHAPPRDRPA